MGRDVLAVQLAELARSLQRQSDPEATLRDVVRAAVELIPGVDEGSISLVMARRHVTSQAPSAELPRIVDALQEETGQGPCLDAVYEQQTVRVSDMHTEQRWPLFAARAAAAGAGGMLSFQLYVEGGNLGALNLCRRRAGTLDDESEHVGLLFAARAAVAYAAATTQANLDQALTTSRLLGQAQGILIERHKITGEQAFALLIAASQRRNVKVRDLAEDLVRSGDRYRSARSAGRRGPSGDVMHAVPTVGTTRSAAWGVRVTKAQSGHRDATQPSACPDCAAAPA